MSNAKLSTMAAATVASTYASFALTKATATTATTATASAAAFSTAAAAATATATTATASAAAAAAGGDTATAAAFRTIAQSRRSARRFDPGRTIPDYIMKDVLETTLTSPSGFNLQPMQVILVRSPQLKSRLATHAMLGPGNSYRTTDSSALAVFLSDLELSTRIRRIYDLERLSNARPSSYLSTMPIVTTFMVDIDRDNLKSSSLSVLPSLPSLLRGLAADALRPLRPMPTFESIESWSAKNVSLAAMTYVYAAQSHGLATCMMEGYDATRVKEILRIPDRYGVPIAVATGYEYREESEGGGGHVGGGCENVVRTPRLNMEEVFFGDTFGGELDVLSVREGETN